MHQTASRRFGRYEILSELGRGAMGVVFKARDPQIDRLVAVKTIFLRSDNPEEDAEYRQRFLNEAQAAGRLHHPGIVAIYDFGQDEETGDPFLVLEHVQGQTLSKLLATEKKLPLEKAVSLAEEIAQALDYAHSQGVIHRDIKPGNILVTETGHAKIADFGVAKLNLALFTLPGRMLGTPAYGAPEQLNGEGVDGRSDLFSLGVVLYAMVVGYSPFQGNSATTVFHQVANREPLPASTLVMTLPPQVDSVIARAMAKNPKDRYQTGAELAADLRKLLTKENLPVSPTNRKHSSPCLGGHAQACVDALKGIATAIHKVRIRDLFLAAGVLCALIIFSVESKFLASSHPMTDAPVVRYSPSSAAASTGVATPNSSADDAKVPASASAAPSTVSRSGENKGATKANVVKPQNLGAPSLHAVAAGVKQTTNAGFSPALPCTINLAITYPFKEATLSVWVDNGLVLTHALRAGAQKRLVVFGNAHSYDTDTLPVPAGQHSMYLQAETSEHQLILSKIITDQFAAGCRRTLQVSFDKHDSAILLDWQ
jgi:serine/threonine protein kinase